MSAMKRLFAVLVAVVGMVVAAATIGAGTASAYPVGTQPTIALSATTVSQGGSLTVTGDNFTPNASATLTLHSTPVALGTVSTDANGQFSAQITVPTYEPAGEHTVEALDQPTGDIAAAGLVVVAGGNPGGGNPGGGNPGGGLAGTGVAVSTIGGVGLVLLVGGGLLLMSGRRRKASV